MKVTEFLEGRDVDRQAVTRYIGRHPEFDGHAEKNGKEIELDDYAVGLLDKMYPLVKPAVIVNGVPHEDYIELQKKYEKLLEYVRTSERNQANLEIAQARIEAESNAQRILLEDRQKQLEEEKKRADMEHERAEKAEKELDKYHKSIFGLYKKYQN